MYGMMDAALTVFSRIRFLSFSANQALKPHKAQSIGNIVPLIGRFHTEQQF